MHDCGSAPVSACGPETVAVSWRPAAGAADGGDALYRFLAENTGDVIVRCSLEGHLLYVSPAAHDLFGRAPSDLLGARILDLVHPDSSGSLGARIAALASGTSDRATASYRARRQDGAWIWVETGFRLVRTPAGEPQEIVGITRDITERVRMEERFRQSQKIEAVGQLTGGIAHDFNNLLLVILGHAELLVEDLADAPHLRRNAELIATMAENGSRLVHKLLTFSRRQALDPQPLAIAGAMETLAAMLARTLGEQVEIRADIADGLPEVVVDHAEFEAALINLAVNARDAMPNGGRLLLEAEAVTVDGEEFADRLGPGSYVRVAVTDTGTGMPPELVERVFEPFFTTKEAGKGSGLGLSMVYGFAKQSGGHAAIYSEPGYGTTVSLYLPAVASAGPAAAGEAAAIPQACAETVLVIEDETPVRQFLTATLMKLGYRVVACEDGPTALAEFERGTHVDLLLTDVVLPSGLTGRQVARQIREVRPALRVLFMSGYPDTVLAERGTVDGGLRVLRKPFRRVELAQALREALAAEPVSMG
jgi:PAS domain S-box-containing protein